MCVHLCCNAVAGALFLWSTSVAATLLDRMSLDGQRRVQDGASIRCYRSLLFVDIRFNAVARYVCDALSSCLLDALMRLAHHIAYIAPVDSREHNFRPFRPPFAPSSSRTSARAASSPLSRCPYWPSDLNGTRTVGGGEEVPF